MHKRHWAIGIALGWMLLTSSIVAGSTWTVTSTNDSGIGTLREAIPKAQPGDTITFDQTVFPPHSPATIFVTTELPALDKGNVTIDASDAGVILDGSPIGTTPETTLIDDVSLTFDGGTNVLINGDFSAGMNHWSSLVQSGSGHIRGLNTSDWVSASPSYSIQSVASNGWAFTFYDTLNRSVQLTNWPDAQAVSGYRLCPASKSPYISISRHLAMAMSICRRFEPGEGGRTWRS